VLLPEFARRRVQVGEVTLQVAVGGHGPPVVLLHGYPQTHACWHAVAPRLAGEFTVVCPDLRGYGDSDKPEGDPDHQRYAKRAMAADIHRLMTGWHLLLMAQPPDFPERLIGAGAELWLDHLLDSFCGTPGAVIDEARDAYRRSFLDPATIHATCEDYRAGATVDLAHDAADRERGRRIGAPVLVLWQQPPGMELPFDPLAVWRGWADEVEGHGLACGHLLAEERPGEVVEALRAFLARGAPA
jgi:haloacetate dehalogenase